MSVTIGGTYSGLNVSSIIAAVIAADSIPITNLQTTNTNLQTRSTDLGAIGTSLGELSTVLQTLGSNTLFTSQTATLSNTAIGTATVDSTAKPGATAVNITQLATTSVLRSGNAAGAYADTKLAAPPAATTLLTTALNETSVNGQTFSVNGKIITLADTDTLGDVVTKINNSGAGVTASYDAGSGKVSLSAGSTILLGSAADTSDFLQQAQLFNDGSGTVTSASGLGRIDPGADLATAGLRTAPTAGTFTINGVSINYNAGDTLADVMSNINNSSAGVTAVYDSYQDQIVLSSTQRGPQSITVADGTSNLATALRLGTTDSTLTAGKTTQFTVGDSTTVRQSNSNVLTSDVLGVPGMTFTATGLGSTQVTVAPDVSNIATALNAFVTQYNATQTTINQYMAINTADTSQDGALADDNNLTFLAPQLRQVVAGSISNTATIRMLSDLGITTNANDNTLTNVDPTKLQNALTNNLSEVEALFNDPTNGLTTTVQSVIETYNSSLNGVIVNEQNAIAQQVSFNKQQISRMQQNLQAEQTNLENEFATLDAVIAQSNGLSSIFNAGTCTSSSSGSSSSSSSGGSVGSSTIGS